MEDYLLDWLGLLVRWLHLVAGVAWIGASFYFVWLDNHLEPPAAEAGRADPAIGGELYAVHGGGFYRAQKYRVAPPVLPPTLHWFKWEAYTTWLSGMALLVLLYLLRAEAYLIDPAVHAWSKPAAVALALGVLVVSWLVYDALCRSPLGRRPTLLAALLGVLLVGLAFGLCALFSGRGAYMLFGSALGTIMVGNVLLVIIPGQRELVRAKAAGRDPDPAPGLRGKQRSVHNTYFTLPVLFVMIGNHYAMTYGARDNWLVLVAICFAGAAIRAAFVARHRAAASGGRAPLVPATLGVLALLATVVALAPAGSARPVALQAERARGGAGVGSGALPTDPLRVAQIVARRCAPCHAVKPTEPGFGAPPNGVVLEGLDQVRAHRPQVAAQLASHAMPVGNLTAMTDEERATLLDWVRGNSPP